ncbi:MAG: aromatic ring-hydroxylating dioxygenase subunit alpha [Nitrospirae bacterium]|nr:MAG: aromatic ring-hydroxylating dioxygenase subunit alpha [Nitrospirota bacterium]
MDSLLEPGALLSRSVPLFGFWYPAIAASQIRPGKIKAQVLLGEPLAICRNQQGQPFAFRDICPHRGMPLSFGQFNGDRLECSYHGWQFDMAGRCRHIPALTADDRLQPEKIGVTTYPCQERNNYIWVYMPDVTGKNPIVPEVPRLPLYSDSYRFLHISTMLKCTIDDGIVGLMDPAHGPFVHQSWFWRSRDSIHEKAKDFEPIPYGFRMKAHTPSRNSAIYKVLGLYGEAVSTTIEFVLPNLRYEIIRCGPYWFSSLATVTPITENECRIDFCAAWNLFRWVPLSKTIFRLIARHFLNQDKRVMERQAIGLRYKPALMLIDDADTPAKWYYKLKAAYLASCRSGNVFEHPLKEPVTLRWRS